MRIAVKFLVIITMLGAPLFLQGQQAKIDSLISLIRTDKEDTAKVNHLHDLISYYAWQNSDTAFQLCNEAMAISRKLNWKAGLGQSHYKLAILNEGKGDYLLALKEYEIAMKIWEEIESGDHEPEEKKLIKNRKCKTLTNMGNGYAMQGDFPKALKYSFDALRIAEEIGNKHMQANNLGSIGSIFNRQKEFNKALEYYFKALKIYEELKMRNGLAYCYIGIGNTYNDLNDFDKALEYYFKSLRINEETDNKPYIAANLGNIGNAYLRQKKNDKALEYLSRALKMDEEQGNSTGMAYRLSSLGSLYIKLKKYEEAEKYLIKGLTLAEGIGSLNLQQDNHADLSEMYSLRKDFERSLFHFKKYSSIKDSLFNEEKNNELTRYEMNFEFEKKESALKAEQDKKEAVALADRKRQKLFFGLICLVAFTISVIALMVFRSLRIAKKQKQIIEQQKLLVEDKQKEILDSIQYAKRIQLSLLPTDSYIQKNIDRLRK
ncbi:MAG: protein serine/threonine phosphatase [Bacteroidetes bacterium]|nr:protein serine/threonine phosphatase [Bacteroidota bacterium]